MEARLELLEPRPRLGAQRVAERGPGDQEHRGRAQGGGDDDPAGAQDVAEQEAAGDRHHRAAGQRKGDHDCVDRHEKERRGDRVFGDERGEQRAVLAQRLERDVLIQPKREKRDRAQHHNGDRRRALERYPALLLPRVELGGRGGKIVLDHFDISQV